MFQVKVVSLFGTVATALVLLSGAGAQAQEIPIPDYSIVNNARINSASLQSVVDGQRRSRKRSVVRTRRARKSRLSRRTQRSRRTRSIQRSRRYSRSR